MRLGALVVCGALAATFALPAQAVNFELFFYNTSEQTIKVEKVEYRISTWETNSALDRHYEPGQCAAWSDEPCHRFEEYHYVSLELKCSPKRDWRVTLTCNDKKHVLKVQNCKGNTSPPGDNCVDSLTVSDCSGDEPVVSWDGGCD